MRFLFVALMVLWMLVASRALAADTETVLPWRQDRPPNRAFTPEEALSRFTVPDGFHVDLVASEPEIVNPIAMAFDDRGRIWITQSVEYPRKSAGPGRDRVMLIDGIDDSGHATRVSTFVDD